MASESVPELYEMASTSDAGAPVKEQEESDYEPMDDGAYDMEEMDASYDPSEDQPGSSTSLRGKVGRIQTSRSRITPEQKRQICEFKANHPNAVAREIFLHFRQKWPDVVVPSTINKILQNRERWTSEHEEVSYRVHHPRHRLEAALYLWYMNYHKIVDITNDMLKQKAADIARELKIERFGCSNAWVHSFKKRHNILKYSHKKVSGSKILSIDLDYAYDEAECDNGMVSAEKVTYYTDDETNGTLQVKAPIMKEEAQQGLMFAMGYLAANPTIARNYIDLLWDVFQQIYGGPAVPKLELLNGQDDSMVNYMDDEPDGPYLKKLSGEESSVSQEAGVLDDSATEVKSADGLQVHDENGVLSIPNSEAGGQVQYAVQTATGEYILVVTESEGGEVDLAKTLPDILSAAGHSPSSASQFVERIDPASGMRTLTLENDSPDDTLFEIVNSANQAASEGAATAMSKRDLDHQYMTQEVDESIKSALSMASPGKPPGNTSVSGAGKKMVTKMSPSAGLNDKALEIGKDGKSTMKPVVVLAENDEEEDQVTLVDLESGDEIEDESVVKDCSVKIERFEGFDIDAMGHRTMFVCDECGVGFPFLSHLRTHMRIHDKEKKDRVVLEAYDAKKEMYVCNVCKKCFSRHSSYRSHMRHHTGECQCSACVLEGKAEGSASPAAGSKSPARTPARVIGTASPRPSVNSPLAVPDDESEDVKPHICETCGRCFNREQDLKLHVQVHEKKAESESGFQCPICEKYFPRPLDLSRHLKSHVEKAPPTCTICKKSFSLNSNLKKHMRLHTGVHDYTCQCGDKFLTVKELSDHRASTGHHNKWRAEKQDDDAEKQDDDAEKMFQCEVCSKSFRVEKNLKLHALWHDKGMIKPTKNEGKYAFKCGKCPRAFRLQRNLDLHKVLKHSAKTKTSVMVGRVITSTKPTSRLSSNPMNKPFPCDVCGSGFSLQRNMLYHRKKKHLNAGKRPIVKPKLFQEEKQMGKRRIVKPKLFQEEKKMGKRRIVAPKRFIKESEEEDPAPIEAFKCKKCDRSFAKQAHLNSHNFMKHRTPSETPSETPSKPAAAQLSTVKTPSVKTPSVKTPSVKTSSAKTPSVKTPSIKTPNSTAKKTPKTSVKKNVRTCLTCNETYTNVDEFTAHIKTHIEETLYRCPVCSEFFKQASQLQEHILIHTEKAKKTHKCPTCKEVFDSGPALRHHINTHIEEDEDDAVFYECPKCGKHMTSANSLKKHMQVHEENRQMYPCPECTMEFQYPYNMKRHLKQNHPEAADV